MRANWLCGRFCVQASSFENYIAEKAFTDRFVQQSPSDDKIPHTFEGLDQLSSVVNIIKSKDG
ncbi:hypothetical protein ABLT40_11605 [Acinetobacter schindleri]|uniref:hypothetical protein n=1 Tax=Acinetobacter schindleri TaxID=108981 RepID=UPI0032B4061C